MNHDFDHALDQWEALSRPGLPVDGYLVERLPGEQLPSVHHFPSGRRLPLPAGAVQRVTPAPVGPMLAVSIAPLQSEFAALYLYSAVDDQVHLVPGLTLRYDTPIWDDDGLALRIYASKDAKLYRVDAKELRVEELAFDVASGVRVQLIGGNSTPLALLNDQTGGVTLRNLNTGTELLKLPEVQRICWLSSTLVVQQAGRLSGFRESTEGLTKRWQWHSPAPISQLLPLEENLLIHRWRDGRSEIVSLDPDAGFGEPTSINSESDLLTVTGMTQHAGDVLLRVEGQSTPPRLIPWPKNNQPTARFEPETSSLRTTEISAIADDGVELRLIVTSPCDAVGPLPTILSCYGGFGVVNLPVFEPSVLAWCSAGGRYVTAQIRGGGEGGAEWHLAARGINKLRAIEDLAAAARTLLTEELTSVEQLMLLGASHGGTVVAACGLRHPDLCAAVISSAAPLDLLRLADNPLGEAWKSEFGDPTDARVRTAMAEYSPLELARAVVNIDGKQWPHFLCITQGADERVEPSQATRFAETLRQHGIQVQEWTNPKAGHGVNPLSKVHDYAAKILTFAAESTLSHTPARE